MTAMRDRAQPRSERGQRRESMFPLNGWRVGALPSGDHEVHAAAPLASMFARVVSKWVLYGTTLPGPPSTENRIRSAAAALVGRDHVVEAGIPAPRRDVEP